MDNEVVADCRWHNNKLFYARQISIRHMHDEITILISLDDIALCEEQLEIQFTTNNSWAIQNERYYG